ncbi:MAG: alpha/beta hydrolase [Anaerolineae bacterium]|jgi:pimeloyl-ACP methyl ester carboxylesterase|nr:alpha/beta hydrolase [Anaerolineae bacterium]
MTYDMRFIRTNGVTLHTITAGDEKGEPIVLLHGFPEYWYGWRNQIPYLAERGYHVIVPDQRGYNFSDKPGAVRDYRISTLAADIKGLIEALGYERVTLVGHDWGGAVAWWMATLYPEHLKKLIVLNIPYPTIVFDALRQFNLMQALRSWYIGFFQMPFVPEEVLKAFDYQGLANALQATARKGTFSDADMVQYRQAWSQPGALTAMLNWYRAALQARSRSDAPAPGGTRITTPTLLLWGERDLALGSELAQPSIDLCDDGKVIFFPDASHWLQHEEVDAVNEHIHRFAGS